MHVHSHYSLLDGLSKIPKILDKCQADGQTAIALTDHGVLYGALEFYKEAKSRGLKPIIGMEAYYSLKGRLEKNGNREDDTRHLILLAKNLAGYKNLLKISTIGHLEGYYYKPRIDWEVLEKYHEGLIALSACLGGEIPRLIQAGEYEKAKTRAIDFETLFGKGNYYLEIQHHESLKEQQAVNDGLKRINRETGIPLVATADSHYIALDDREAQDVLVCIETGKIITDTKRFKMTDIDVSLKSEAEMRRDFADIPEAIENTNVVAASVNLELELGKWIFPDFPVPDSKTAPEFLREEVNRGLLERLRHEKNNPTGSLEELLEAKVCERVDYELDIITKKGYSTYFLIVADYVRWSREQGVVVTTRGSAAGSIVTYALGITTVNPLYFDLPFERFLNPFRPSPPDIDVDFADNKRDMVFQYVKEKYGADRVSHVITFGTMAARASVRDVTRVLGLPYGVGDKIAKMIPFGVQGAEMTLERALMDNKELKQFYDTDQEAKRIIDLAHHIEGSVRHASVHAAAVVIAPTPLVDYSPMQREPGGEEVISQYDMYSIEDAGLMKMDFLGIRNLSILGLARDLVVKTKGVKIDLDKLPFDDARTFKFLAEGSTMGVFQLSGEGMTKHLKELKPTNIFDIMVMVALYRPGPMKTIDEYIARKNGQHKIKYYHPKMEKFLQKTFGLLVYQDDLLLTAIELAGYDWGEVDKFRKAVGKKIPAEMAKQEKIFIAGCQKFSGMTKSEAEEIWELFDPFKGYGFNKAHAASYAVVAYQTGYMKAHFPAEYMTAILTAESNDIEKIAEIVTECRRLGIEVLSPDLNESNEDFTYINDQQIRFGLVAIKNIGAEVAKEIIAERERGGKFISLEDFLSRVPGRAINRKSLEAFIKSGATDSLGERGTLLGNIEALLAYHKDQTSRQATKQVNLFGASDHVFKNILKLATHEPLALPLRLSYEKELLGLYLTDHPFKEWEGYLREIVCPINMVGEYAEGADMVVGGVVENQKKIFTKSGEPMIFAGLEDTSGKLECIVFPKILRDTGPLWEIGRPLIVAGKLSKKDGADKILVNQVKIISLETIPEIKRAFKKDHETFYDPDLLTYIYLEDKIAADEINKLKDILTHHPGSARVCFVVKKGSSAQKVLTNYYVQTGEPLRLALQVFEKAKLYTGE